jgi:hypothetical protein
MVVPMLHTTPHKEDKAGTSSAEAPMVWALVAWLGSKKLDDNLADNNLNLLNFNAMDSEIICRTSS